MNNTEKIETAIEIITTDYTFTGDKEASDWVYEFTDRISEEDWIKLTEDKNKAIEFIGVMAENLTYKEMAEVITHYTDLLAEAADL